jgi:hypothetical protein
MPCDDGLQISSNFVNLAQAECAAAMASVPELPKEAGGVRSPRLSLDRFACRQQTPHSPTCRLTSIRTVRVMHMCTLAMTHVKVSCGAVRVAAVLCSPLLSRILPPVQPSQLA